MSFMDQPHYDRREAFKRSLPLFGEEGMEALSRSRVVLVGLGGVGGSAAEALARAGVMKIDLIDGDCFALSNLNRQRFAFLPSIGKKKAEAVAEALKGINPEGLFRAFPRFITPENLEEFPLEGADYVIDAIDQVQAKLSLIEYCAKKGIPLISAMGTGFKLDPTLLKVADISKTEMDPLAKKVRCALRKRGIFHLKVVFSPEPPIGGGEENVVLSSPFVPNVAGILLAKEAVKDLLETKERKEEAH